MVGLLRGAMSLPAAVRVSLADRMAARFKAVPDWMLEFGSANKDKHTAAAGLETFKARHQSNTFQSLCKLINDVICLSASCRHCLWCCQATSLLQTGF